MPVSPFDSYASRLEQAKALKKRKPDYEPESFDTQKRKSKLPNKINYAGAEVHLSDIYDEEEEPRWQDKAQGLIDSMRKRGVKACCLHHGKYHGYYEER